MKCLKCGFENPDEVKFCGECGTKLENLCLKCHHANPPSFKFCGECGSTMDAKPAPKEEIASSIGERKHVTILFSDLSGYTAMAEKLDPENVKEITGKIFGQIAVVIDKYEGVVEKYIGDAVMAVFGIPLAHEDDPIRAIKAAREIHQLVDTCGYDVENQIGCTLSMHTGIHTGLVVTGESDLEKGIHGVAGDTVNIASRLSSIAGKGQILVGPVTYRQAEGHFVFETLEPATVKGRSEPIKIYKVLSPREKTVSLHRLSGRRARLTGRKVEMSRLRDAVERLDQGKGTVISICGDAGTGKSRLVEEFKETLDLDQIQWIDGHAYAYSQNIPYFQIIDLFNSVFSIKEGDSTPIIRKKITSGLTSLGKNDQSIFPYIGSLYSIPFPELEEVNPELWKSRLQKACIMVISALAKKKKTVFFLEDLHWADKSSVDLLRMLLSEIRDPAIVLCVHRPAFSLFTSYQQKELSKNYQEIKLQDLSLSEAQDMLESLLESEKAPVDLYNYVKDKAEGNPFYLEELVNSLIESDILIKDEYGWHLTRSISESEISSTLQGLILSRIDRLEQENKRIIQEASVIGRTFFYDILKRVTHIKDQCEGCLYFLEGIDIIRRKAIQPDLEYIFKHALTQEIAYNGLLKKEREDIHERIALVMEELFAERMPEFYEILAFHFSRSRSSVKAAEYLARAGEKSLARYSVEESDQYFKEAFHLLTHKEKRSGAEDIVLVDLINNWGYVFYFLGEFKKFIHLLNTHMDLAKSLCDDVRLGMFTAWHGISYYMIGRPKQAYDYLCDALALAKKSSSRKVEGYACTWLTWTCIELGRLDDAEDYGQRAQKIATDLPSDQYLYFKSRGGLSFLHYHKGQIPKAIADGELLLTHGEQNANSRSNVMGHWIFAMAKGADGELESAKMHSLKCMESCHDPLYQNFGFLSIAWVCLTSGVYKEAEKALKALVDFSEKRGEEQFLCAGYLFLGPVLVATGRMSEGMNVLEKARQMIIKNGRGGIISWYEYIVGSIYSQMATGPKPAISVIAKNLGFIVTNVPFAAKRAEDHLKKAIELSKQIGANGFLGLSYLELGLLYKSRKQNGQARQCLGEAVKIFEQGGFKNMFNKATDALSGL